MYFTKASVAWEMEKEKRDAGRAWDHKTVIASLRVICATLRAISEPIDPSLPQSIATESGLTGPDNASDEDWLRVAEDLYAKHAERNGTQTGRAPMCYELRLVEGALTSRNDRGAGRTRTCDRRIMSPLL